MSWLRRRDLRGTPDHHAGNDAGDGPRDDDRDDSRGEGTDAATAEGDAEEAAAPPAVEEEDPRPDRSHGPFDITEVDPDTAADRIDLGALQLPSTPGLELRLEVEEATGQVVAVTAVLAESAVQIRVFAAPRTFGIWREVRAEIAESILEQGGSCQPVEGTFGPEIVATLPEQAEAAGGPGVARFIGVDGPRWFLRGVLTGAAALDPTAAAPLLDLLRGVVVVRGSEAMAPRDMLTLHLPRTGDEAAAAAPGAP